jgi:hypothetical protein
MHFIDSRSSAEAEQAQRQPQQEDDGKQAQDGEISSNVFHGDQRYSKISSNIRACNSTKASKSGQNSDAMRM